MFTELAKVAMAMINTQPSVVKQWRVKEACNMQDPEAYLAGFTSYFTKKASIDTYNKASELGMYLGELLVESIE